MRNYYLVILCFLLGGVCLQAQPTYNMSNLTVDDCEGILLDSELGDLPGTYDHNEDYTFTIAVPDADQIILSFATFCTEEGFDFMRFFDGPDTLSMQIGDAYSGEVDPPNITATSGYLTIHFMSDPNVVCTGWFANWTTEVLLPEPPDILAIQPLDCESDAVTFTFAEPVACDDLTIDAFNITGPILPTITSVTPNNCVNGTATSVTINFTPDLDRSGTYELTFISNKSICANDYVLQSIENFDVTGCPLFLEIDIAADTLCQELCTWLIADVSGGDASSYDFQWSPPAANQDSIWICLTDTITYSVTVTDGAGATITDDFLIEPLPLPEILNGDLTICQSVDTLFLMAMPEDGIWSASGIDEDNEETGYYLPELLEANRDTVTYTSDVGCSSQIFIDIIPLDEGTDDASCPGADTFFVSGGLPIGGEWSGDFITIDGIFSPDSIGSFEVTYTHPNGCSGTKTVNVDSLDIMPIDSICQSVEPFEIEVIPFGGIWTGEGIVNEDTGLFDPSEVGNEGVLLHYEINGCRDSVQVPIKEINARGNFTTCPDQDEFILPGNWGPAGGYWTGIGITDSLSGMYDPSIIEEGENDTLTYFFEGCEADRVAFVRYTTIEIDTLMFCANDESLELNRDNTGRGPNRGVWTGPGVVHVEDFDYYFNPELAGAGAHILRYENNTCSDSMTVIVLPIPQIQSQAICEETPPVQLDASIDNGEWSGDGIINPDLGIFDASEVGGGLHEVFLTSEDGCIGSQNINVIPFRDAELTGVEDDYCYKDTIVQVQTSPNGGDLFLNNNPANYFNPLEAGTGTHILQYHIGEGDCADSTKFFVTVGAPLELTLPVEEDTICYGYSLTLNSSGGGGIGSNYSYTWNGGLGTGNTQYASPSNTTEYMVTLEDGCTEAVTKSLNVFVHPQINTQVEAGAPVCYEDSTFAMVDVYPESDYTIAWSTSPITYGNTIVSHPRSYVVTITDENNGCFLEDEVTVPGYPLITANFDIFPANDCVNMIEPMVEVIDYSVNGVNGYWDFGDSEQRELYQFGQNISHVYQDTGVYTITLHLENGEDCFSEHQMEVCVEPAVRLFAPNAFTPNYDGKNDFFAFKGFGIENIEWQVLNRWGEILYVGNGMDDSWDGSHKGKMVPPGVYTFIAKYKGENVAEEEVMKGVISILY